MWNLTYPCISRSTRDYFHWIFYQYHYHARVHSGNPYFANHDSHDTDKHARVCIITQSSMSNFQTSNINTVVYERPNRTIINSIVVYGNVFFIQSNHQSSVENAVLSRVVRL